MRISALAAASLAVLSMAVTSFAKSSPGDIRSDVGRVEIGRGAANELIVAVDLTGDEGGVDGLADVWFVLASETELDVEPRSFERADIVFASGRLRVVARPSGNIVDVLIGDERPLSSPPSGVPVRVYRGYGLSRYDIDSEVALEELWKLSEDERVRGEGNRRR